MHACKHWLHGKLKIVGLVVLVELFLHVVPPVVAYWAGLEVGEHHKVAPVCVCVDRK